MLDDLPPSDEDQYSDDSMSDHKDFEDLGDNALAQRYQMLEAEVDAWTPAKMYRMASLGPFIWAVLRDSPEKFNGYMDAMISSGQSITRRLFAFLTELNGMSADYAEGIEALYFRVHLAMAAVQLRWRMVKAGFIDKYPQILEWEDPDDSWTTFEEYFGVEELLSKRI